MSNLESLIRRTANRVGLDITRYRPTDSATGRLVTMLGEHRVDLVLDVGANIGQFAQALRQAGYRERIVSFEPLPAAWQQLRHASLGDPQWDVAPPMALGRDDGEIAINIAGNSVSSSVLAMLDTHASAAPASAYVGQVTVPLMRLGAVAADYVDSNTICFLKIDTQGYESQVLDGAGDFLDRAAGVQLELSLVPLYAGQELYRALIDRLTTKGFDLWGIFPGFFDPANGRMLQVDAVFFRGASGGRRA
jgi:FkbM family methyltransferase